MPKICIVDLKLNVYGPKEDEVYSSLPLLVKNIRRGNTILSFDDGRYSFGRKGLEKFYDMRYEFISSALRYKDCK